MKWLTLCGLMLMALASGCASRGPERELVLAPRVEVPRFMGDWYVLASIPLWPERDSYNGVESYRLDEEGRIQTTYTFRKGGFDGPQKTYRPVGRVHNQVTGSEWRMQFFWPFRAAFLIHYVDEAYQATIIGEPSLKYVWIMARQPQLAEADLQALIQRTADIGYDISKLRRVPQRWN